MYVENLTLLQKFCIILMLIQFRLGEMVERLKAPVLKTGVGQPTVGSNPTLSVLWRSTQEAEGDGLLNR